FGLKAFVTGVQPEQTSLPLMSAGIASLVLAAFSFTLPHTPPPARGQAVSARSIIGLDAFKQLGSPSFWVFIISALLICIPLAAYYNFTQLFLEAAQVKNIAATQTLGQMSEMLFMLAMPLMFRRLGVKWMLVLGMSAWVVRYALFASAAPSLNLQQWQQFWWLPAGFALFVTLFFAFAVRDRAVDQAEPATARAA